MTTLPPDWAIQRAIELSSAQHHRVGWEPSLDHIKKQPEYYPTKLALAKYISEKETPPPRRNVLLVRKLYYAIYGKRLGDLAVFGGRDNHPAFKRILDAIDEEFPEGTRDES